MFDRMKRLSEAGPPLVWHPWMLLVPPILMAYAIVATGSLMAVFIVAVCLMFGWQAGIYMAIRGYQVHTERWDRWFRGDLPRE